MENCKVTNNFYHNHASKQGNTIERRSLLPVPKFLTGLKLKWDLLSWQHLSPLADVVRIICPGPMNFRYRVSTTAVGQRHSVDTAQTMYLFFYQLENVVKLCIKNICAIL